MRRFAHPWDLLQELVRDARADAALVVADRRDVLDLVDEDDGLRQVEEQVERIGEELRLPVGAFGSDLGRLDLHERPAEAGCDSFRERRLAGPGRPEEDDRLRRRDGVPRRQARLGQRQDDAPLDDLLGLVHPAQLVPQPRRDRAAAECLERGRRAELFGERGLKAAEQLSLDLARRDRERDADDRSVQLGDHADRTRLGRHTSGRAGQAPDFGRIFGAVRANVGLHPWSLRLRRQAVALNACGYQRRACSSDT